MEIIKSIKSILIIDDDHDDCAFFKDALSDLTSTIQLTSLHICEQVVPILDHCLPDLIFLDINLPRIDGFECLKHIQNNAQHCNIPIIMYSSSNSPKELLYAFENGVTLFFKKPTRYADLIESLRGILLMDWEKPSLIKQQYFKDGKYQFFNN